MQVTTYFQPIRTYLPCTGVGKHINNILLRLGRSEDFSISCLVAQGDLEEGKLDNRCPLHTLNVLSHPYNRLMIERCWKLLDYPKMDLYVDTPDCLYSPVAEYVPVNSDIPSIITIHDVHPFETDLPWAKSIGSQLQRLKTFLWLSKAIHKANIVCTVSNFSKQRIVDLLGVNPEKIMVVGNGIDDHFFQASSIGDTTQFPFQHPYVVVVGGLRFKKGGDYVLSVARELQQRKSSLKIVVIGANEENLVEKAKCLDSITLLGLIADEELPRLLCSASSLLFLSLYEGFGIPALEAMAVGTPAVVSNFASLPEIVGDAGITVDPEQTNYITDILMNLEADSHLRQDYSQRGQQRAAQYTWSNCVDRVTSVLEQFA